MTSDSPFLPNRKLVEGLCRNAIISNLVHLYFRKLFCDVLLYIIAASTIPAMATELKTADEVAKSIGIPPAELDRQISDYHLSKISLFLGWQKIARHLGLSDINVKDIIKENPGDEDMRRWKTLTKWTGLYGTGATYRFLVEAHLTVQEINDAQEVCRLLRCTDAGMITRSL